MAKEYDEKTTNFANEYKNFLKIPGKRLIYHSFYYRCVKLIDDYDSKMKLNCFKRLSDTKVKLLEKWYDDQSKIGCDTVSTISIQSKLEIIEKLNYDLDEDNDDYHLNLINLNRLNRWIKRKRLNLINEADKSGKNIRKRDAKYIYSNQQMCVINCCGVLDLVDPSGHKFLKNYGWLIELFNAIKLIDQKDVTKRQFSDLKHDIKRTKNGRFDWNRDYGTVKCPAGSNDFNESTAPNLNQINLSQSSTSATRIVIKEENLKDNLTKLDYSLEVENMITTTRKFLFSIYKLKTTDQPPDSNQHQTNQSLNRMEVDDNDYIILD